MEFSLLLDAILIGILLLIATVILEPLAGYLYEKEVLHLNANIKLNLFSHIEKLPISYFDTKHSGEVFARINNDLDRLGETYPKLYELLETVIYGFGCSLVIILIDWRLAIFVMVMGFVTSWINTLFIEPIRKYSDKIQKGQGSNLQGYNDIINGVRHIKIYRITLPIHRLINGNNLVAKLSIQRSGKLAQMTSTNFLLSSINTAGTIVFGAYLINNDYTSLGAVIAVITLQYGLTEMFLDLGSCFANLQSSLSGAFRVFELLDSKIESKHSIRNLTSKAFDSDINDREVTIKFEDVYFSYENTDSMLLNGFTCKIKKGKVTALVGNSGGGKSTIAKILLSFYQPKKGAVELLQKPLNHYDSDELRDMIAYVPQETFLFEGTIADNIRVGSIYSSKSDIAVASKLANIYDFILDMEHGFESVIGERGATLSGGQKQRIAIARAILKNAPIFIFDEATSELDINSERLIQQTVQKLKREKTVIVIAHRLSTVEQADWILVMDNGKIVEEGTHHDLLGRSRRYTELFKRS